EVIAATTGENRWHQAAQKFALAGAPVAGRTRRDLAGLAGWKDFPRHRTLYEAFGLDDLTRGSRWRRSAAVSCVASRASRTAPGTPSKAREAAEDPTLAARGREAPSSAVVTAANRRAPQSRLPG